MKKALLAFAVVVTLAGRASAAVWYYDISSSPGLGGTPAPGNWASGAGGLMWTMDPTGSTAPVATSWSVAANNDAIFDGIPAAIPITSGGVVVGSLEFRVDGYSLNAAAVPGEVNFVSSTRNTVNVVNAGHTATINSPFQGATGYTKTGAGTLVLTNATANNNITGAIRISGGVLELTAQGAIGATSAGADQWRNPSQLGLCRN